MPHRPKKRTFKFQIVTAMVTIILVVGYVSFLLFSHYQSQVDLQEILLQQLQKESEKQTLAISYFFSERKDDLANLALSREVTAFFENKDLGMSMEYGIKLSLIPIQERFVELISRKSIQGDPIYSRIAFVEKNGHLLVDSASGEKKGPDLEGKDWLTRTDEGNSVLSSADGREIMVSVPQIYKKKYTGRIVGWIKPEIFYKTLLREGIPNKRITYLVKEQAGNTLLVGAPFSTLFSTSDLRQLTAGEVKSFETKDAAGQVQKRIALRLLIKGTPFSMITVSEAKAVLGNLNPSQLLFRMGILTAAILGGAIFSFYLSFKFLFVRTRLEESIVREQETQEKNRQLEIEMAERRRAEEALRESETKLRTILDSMYTGIMVIDPETHLIVEVNPVAAGLIGESRERIIGSICHSYICPAEKGKCPITDLGQEINNSERLLIRPNGQTCPIIKTVVPITFNGRKHLLENFVDITELKRTEEALKESEKKYRDLMEEAPIGLCNIDVKGNILYLNRRLEEITNYSREELLGKRFPSIGFPFTEIKDKFVDRMAKGVSGSLSLPLEMEIIQKDRNIKWIELEARLINDQEGPPLFQVAVNDITGRKRAQEELLTIQAELEERIQERTADLDQINEDLRKEIIKRKKTEEDLTRAKENAEAANRAKSEFLANMSHELRTPLNHIVGFTEMVVDQIVGPLNTIQDEYLNDVLGSSRHLLSLINDILDLSKVEAGKVSLELSEVKLKPLLENSLIMIKEKALWHKIQLLLDLEALPEKVWADERKLKQILYNLLSNAVKFTPDGGTIRLSAHQIRNSNYPLQNTQEAEFAQKAEGYGHNGEFIKISTVDTGIGLRESDLERIFSPFEQADNSASRNFQGTGLGLSLAKQMIELHGGRIWAESQGEGSGTAFHFTLPIRSPDTC